MGRPRKNPSEPIKERDYTTFRSNTLGGVYIEDTCVYFVNGLFMTSNKKIIDALRKMAHLGVMEEEAVPFS